MTDRYQTLQAKARAQHLDILGAFHPGLPGAQTLCLLAPSEPGFWAHLKGSREFLDAQPDPIDRWSMRVVTELASGLGARAVFPFEGPPYHPFIDWALASGHCWTSPATLLVNDRQGLWVSFRGALIFEDWLALPEAGARPCDTCLDQPCKTACPVAALTAGGYDVAACKAHVVSAAGRDCREGGCLVRRACPVSIGFGRSADQSAHHMAYFL